MRFFEAPLAALLPYGDFGILLRQVLIKFLIVLCVETDSRLLRDKCESGGLLMSVEDY